MILRTSSCMLSDTYLYLIFLKNCVKLEFFSQIYSTEKLKQYGRQKCIDSERKPVCCSRTASFAPRHEKMCFSGYADSEGTDQPVQMRRLTSVFAVRFQNN